MHTIPVICDCCRAEGLTGQDPFESFGDLLDFEPVPRRKARADGWDAEVQRAFIAALSLTGSARQAARAVGKAQFGADQLRQAPGNQGFLAAWDEAMDLAAAERSRRLAEGVRTVAAEQADRRTAPAPWSGAASRRGRRGRPAAFTAAPPAEPKPAIVLPGPHEPGSPEFEWLVSLLRRYTIKVMQEREARLEGEIVAADFYLRQMTWIEVFLDVTSGDGRRFMCEFRAGGHPTDLAESPLSRMLGEVRRQQWARMDEPERPEHPPRRYLVHDDDGYAREPQEAIHGGPRECREEQQANFRERHRRDAEAQLEWEAQARREYERRRDSAADS
ncbi:MAG TPA: hypothetical protein VEZ70_03300 [Allosphingosinicella sp.]|nr:hypothetical protein [Allosphingosinicella sp.]